MHIVKVTLRKEFKIGLPNFSNITPAAEITWELADGEEFDFKAGWDIINQQISNQTDVDPSWIKTDTYKNFYKTTIKTPLLDRKEVPNESNR